MGDSISLLPPVSALSFAPPGNGGVKLGLVDEVRAAVVPILVQDPIPAHLCSEVWDVSSPWSQEPKGLVVSKHVHLKKSPFFLCLHTEAGFFCFVLKQDALSSWYLPSPQFWGTNAENIPLLGSGALSHWMPVRKPAVAWTVLVPSCFAGAALGLFKNDWLSSSSLVMMYGNIPFANMWFIKKRVPVAWWIKRERLGKVNLLVLLACVPPEAGMGVDNGHEGWIHKARRLAITEKFGISLWCFSCRFISFYNWAGLYSMSIAWLLHWWVWSAQC